MATRVLELSEFKQIMELILNGFSDGDGKIFRPNKRLALALQLQSSLGLRIGDILNLRVNNFRNGKLEIKEEKTDKLQYREINKYVYDYIKDYAIENNAYSGAKLTLNARIFNIRRAHISHSTRRLRT